MYRVIAPPTHARVSNELLSFFVLYLSSSRTGYPAGRLRSNRILGSQPFRPEPIVRFPHIYAGDPGGDCLRPLWSQSAYPDT
jgi:hypothetical protein